MRKPNLIEYVYHKGTYYERRYILTSEQASVVQNMIHSAEEVRGWVDEEYPVDRIKKQSMHGLANRILRTAQEMMETFDRSNR